MDIAQCHLSSAFVSLLFFPQPVFVWISCIRDFLEYYDGISTVGVAERVFQPIWFVDSEVDSARSHWSTADGTRESGPHDSGLANYCYFVTDLCACLSNFLLTEQSIVSSTITTAVSCCSTIGYYSLFNASVSVFAPSVSGVRTTACDKLTVQQWIFFCKLIFNK